MNVSLKEPVVTMSISQYNRLKEKSQTVDTKAGVIKQTIMKVYMVEFAQYWKVQEIEDLYRKKASDFADKVLKTLRMIED